MKNTTNERIRYISFKLFLERGYEATNVRDICKEVGIKASTLYFYYKSKEELFFSIYDELNLQQIELIKNIEELQQDICPGTKFYIVYKKKLEFFSENILIQKFLFRYHLFPPEELSKILREKLRLFAKDEKEILRDIIKQCIDSMVLPNNREIDDYLMKYKKFEKFQVLQMILFNIKINDKQIHEEWSKFWKHDMLI